MKALGFMVNGEMFAVDVEFVQKVVRNIALTPLPAAPSSIAGIANLKGGVVTLINFSELIGHHSQTNAAHAIILKPFADGYGVAGLLVDSPSNIISFDEEDILPPHAISEAEPLSLISSLAERDGNLYRIIDIESIQNRF